MITLTIATVVLVGLTTGESARIANPADTAVDLVVLDVRTAGDAGADHEDELMVVDVDGTVADLPEPAVVVIRIGSWFGTPQE